MFPSRKKTKTEGEIVHKKFILTSETYEFGPLLVGKSRDHYKDGKYPENMERIKIMNTSPLEAEISCCFLADSKGETFLLDPPTMILQPGEGRVSKISLLFVFFSGNVTVTLTYCVFRTWPSGPILKYQAPMRTPWSAVSRRILNPSSSNCCAMECGLSWNWTRRPCTLTKSYCTGQ